MTRGMVVLVASVKFEGPCPLVTDILARTVQVIAPHNPPPPPIQQIGNYTLADLTDLYFLDIPSVQQISLQKAQCRDMNRFLYARNFV